MRLNLARYCNMNYLLLLTIHDNLPCTLLLFYNIACQYSKNFLKRMRSYPDELKFNVEKLQIRWAILKNHLPYHSPNCSRFLLNVLQNVAPIYMKGIEEGGVI